MTDQKAKILEFALNLYLEVDAEGRRKNTWDYISKQILKKFKVEIHFTTIQKWSKRNDWESIFEKIKMAGIEKGREQLQEKQNKIIDEKSQVIADVYKSNKQIQGIAKTILLNRLLGKQMIDEQGNPMKINVANVDLIRLLQHSEQTLLSLQDKKREVGNTNVDPFKQIRENAGLDETDK